jgi:hypothetical protein
VAAHGRASVEKEFWGHVQCRVKTACYLQSDDFVLF